MPAQFDGTDEEDNEETINMGVDENKEDEGRIPVIEYDRDNPSIKEESIFPSMTDIGMHLLLIASRVNLIL
jgi:hypothetical protein